MKYCIWCHGTIKEDIEVNKKGKLVIVERCLMCARSTDREHEFEVKMVHQMIDFEVNLPKGKHPQHQMEELFLPLEAGEEEEEEVIGQDGTITGNRFVLF